MAKKISMVIKMAGLFAIFLIAMTSVSPVFAQSAPTGVQTTQSCAPDAPKGFGYYVVRKGDTPSFIASNFGVPLSSVMALNTGASFARNSTILLPSVEAAGKWDTELMCSTSAAIPSFSNVNINAYNQAVTANTMVAGTVPTTVTIPVTGGTTQFVTVNSGVGAVITSTNCAPEAPKGFGYYVVQKGDTPTSISTRLGVPLTTVLGLNSGASFARHTLVLLPSAEAAGFWDNQLLCP